MSQDKTLMRSLEVTAHAMMDALEEDVRKVDEFLKNALGGTYVEILGPRTLRGAFELR